MTQITDTGTRARPRPQWQNVAIMATLAAAAFGAGLVLMGQPAIAAIAFIGMALAATYFAPTAIADSRHHHNLGAIAVVNIFLGWTFIGWVVALAWALTATKRT